MPYRRVFVHAVGPRRVGEGVDGVERRTRAVPAVRPARCSVTCMAATCGHLSAQGGSGCASMYGCVSARLAQYVKRHTARDDAGPSTNRAERLSREARAFYWARRSTAPHLKTTCTSFSSMFSSSGTSTAPAKSLFS